MQLLSEDSFWVGRFLGIDTGRSFAARLFHHWELNVATDGVDLRRLHRRREAEEPAQLSGGSVQPEKKLTWIGQVWDVHLIEFVLQAEPAQ